MTCCDRPSIAIMDFRLQDSETLELSDRVNRCCTRCFAHWAGPTSDVKQYTRKEWDAITERALDG